jgi:hypothetical protein
MTYIYLHTFFWNVFTLWKQFSLFTFREWIFMHKTGELKFPFYRIYETIYSTIHAYLGSIVEQNCDITEINTSEGVFTQ